MEPGPRPKLFNWFFSLNFRHNLQFPLPHKEPAMGRYRVAAVQPDGSEIAFVEVAAINRQSACRRSKRLFGAWPLVRLQASPIAQAL